MTWSFGRIVVFSDSVNSDFLDVNDVLYVSEYGAHRWALIEKRKNVPLTETWFHVDGPLQNRSNKAITQVDLRFNIHAKWFKVQHRVG